jgi:hypothetical protein
MSSGNAGPWTPASPVGFYHGERTGAAAQAFYGQGGALEASGTQANAPMAGRRNIFILANNYNAGALQWSASRVSAAWIGGSLGAARVPSFYTALRTYMTAVGVA